MSALFNRLRRITYSTHYLPQIDGLRFLSLFAVVVIMHITGYLNEKFYSKDFITDEYWQQVVKGGGGGVTFFFMISGFLLSLPFAQWYLKSAKPVSLRNYFLRRLTRLEPPYVIVLLLLFFVQVVVLGKYSFNELLPHLLASIPYMHELIFGSFSPVLPVAWSLEVEVQFYIAAPLLCMVYRMKNPVLRRGVLLLVSGVFIAYWHNLETKPHLLKFLHFFALGMLLTDLHVNRYRLIDGERAGCLAGLLALGGFIFIPSAKHLLLEYFRIACMVLLFHTVLTNRLMSSLFSLRPLVIIGGMCYSIYLLHFAIISFVGGLLLISPFFTGSPSFIPLAFILIAAILLISSLFYLLVEQPFMKWGKKHLSRM